ncbi:hypothetical protein RND81_11G139200 [Saponaria officinalis]|uniref:DUF7026 domain-containing protein n=1 Tax=Saponaria officinalis TaxID=3572 RepID=A0AAW1HLP4_SAPOF
MSQTLISPLFQPPQIFHHHTSNPIYLTSNSKTHQKFLCFSSKIPRKNTKKSISDSQLTSEFAAQVQKINTQIEEKQNALIKSKQMLFNDFCKFLNLNSDETKIKWMKMNPDEKLDLIQGFVCNWGLNFHPLSPKSVRDLIEEFVMNDLVENKENSDTVLGFSRLKKLFMGDY